MRKWIFFPHNPTPFLRNNYFINKKSRKAHFYCHFSFKGEDTYVITFLSLDSNVWRIKFRSKQSTVFTTKYNASDVIFDFQFLWPSQNIWTLSRLDFLSLCTQWSNWKIFHSIFKSDLNYTCRLVHQCCKVHIFWEGH